MEEITAQKTGLKKDWELTQGAFHRLLNWLDQGTDSGGQKYLEMRRRLISFFDRKNCVSPDELADETLNRVMQWLEEKDKNYDPVPAKICYQTASFVFHEYLRRSDREQDSLDQLPITREPFVDPHRGATPEEEQAEKERHLACLEKCSQKLPTSDRDLIIRYYVGEQRVKLENRKALAAERHLTANALSIKACRIREKLRACVTECVYAWNAS